MLFFIAVSKVEQEKTWDLFKKFCKSEIKESTKMSGYVCSHRSGMERFLYLREQKINLLVLRRLS